MTVQDTSLQAYASMVIPRLGQKQFDVLRALHALAECSNAEIAEYLHWPINTVTPRVQELRKIGIVGDAGKRPCRVTGSTVHAWKILVKIS